MVAGVRRPGVAPSAGDAGVPGRADAAAEYGARGPQRRLVLLDLDGGLAPLEEVVRRLVEGDVVVDLQDEDERERVQE